MKIAWFTPLSRRSAIARFSVAVTASLSKLADVELCCFDADDVRETGVATRPFRSAAAVTQETLGRHDIVVYNFGNYLPFHRDIYLASKTVPGICILHDFVMHHFFAGYYFDYLQDPNGYKLLMERTYGESGAIGESGPMHAI